MRIFGAKQLDYLKPSVAREIINDVDPKTLGSLANSNTQAVKNFVNKLDDCNFYLAGYPESITIVEAGKFSDQKIDTQKEFAYALVPLGYIVSGEVVVTKGGKATKRLGAGDFVGLFETSDWLLTSKKRQIGDWTLTTHTDTKVLYFGSTTFYNLEDKTFQEYLINISRSDKVPQPITDLPLLDWVASNTTSSRLPDYAVVAYTHLLPNNFPLFRHLASLVGFGRMYVLEKPYSTVPQTFNDLIQSGCEVIRVQVESSMPYEFAVQKSTDVLWAKVVENQRKEGFTKLLIIDDGGDLTFSLPWEKLRGITVTAVQQTQRGVTRITNSSQQIPATVSVASSGIKKNVESMFIGRSVAKKLQEIGQLNHTIGVLGYGSIGQAVSKSLATMGVSTLFYDNDDRYKQLSNFRPSIDSLLNDADLVTGTIGTDSLKGIPWERIFGNKIFVSASSADVEFASLIKLASTSSDPFGTRHVVVHDKLQVDILNGGYPINFDRRGNATPDQDIVLTRCLMYIGAMEAVSLASHNLSQGKVYGLDLLAQEKLLKRWITDLGDGSPIKISDIKQIVIPSPEPLPPFSVWQE